MKNRKNNEQSLKGRVHGLDFKGISIYNTSNKMFADRIMAVKLLVREGPICEQKCIFTQRRNDAKLRKERWPS